MQARKRQTERDDGRNDGVVQRQTVRKWRRSSSKPQGGVVGVDNAPSGSHKAVTLKLCIRCRAACLYFREGVTTSAIDLRVVMIVQWTAFAWTRMKAQTLPRVTRICHKSCRLLHAQQSINVLRTDSLQQSCDRSPQSELHPILVCARQSQACPPDDPSLTTSLSIFRPLNILYIPMLGCTSLNPY